MKKQNKFRTISWRICQLMTEKQRRKLVARRVMKNAPIAPLAFPLDPAGCKALLIILPEDEVEQLHQIPVLLGILSFFTASQTCILCDSRTPLFFKNLPGVAQTIVYEREERFLFSSAIVKLGRALALKSFDVCLLLEKNPDLALLDLMGLSKAKVRVGYWGCGGYPFVNLSVRLSSSQGLLSASNFSIAGVIGVPAGRQVRWGVSREARDEVAHLLRERRVLASAQLVGVDAMFFRRLFGQPFAEALIRAASTAIETQGLHLYAIAEQGNSAEELAWLNEHGIVVVPPLTASRMVALIDASALLLAGNSLLYQISSLLHKPTIGLFEASQCLRYAQSRETLHVVSYTTNPTEAVVTQAIAVFVSCIGKLTSGMLNTGTVSASARTIGK